jgi:hypothetical protein
MSNEYDSYEQASLDFIKDLSRLCQQHVDKMPKNHSLLGIFVQTAVMIGFAKVNMSQFFTDDKQRERVLEASRNLKAILETVASDAEKNVNVGVQVVSGFPQYMNGGQEN